MDISPNEPQKTSKRFFDIVPANKKVPDTSSRPLVVTNKPKQDDPMVKQSTSIPVDSPQTPPETKGSITINEALESASEPIKLDKPITPEPPRQAVPNAPKDTVPPSTKSDSSDNAEKEVDLDDMPLELPANTPRDVVVSNHGYSVSTIRNIIKVILIILLLVVIADLILDVGYIKSGIWHTHFFGS